MKNNWPTASKEASAIVFGEIINFTPNNRKSNNILLGINLSPSPKKNKTTIFEILHHLTA